MEGCNNFLSFGEKLANMSFNTENGMWRAAIRRSSCIRRAGRGVSIPRTVCGGLQLQIAERFDNPIGVSIPRTVCGGLQYKVYMIFYLK